MSSTDHNDQTKPTGPPASPKWAKAAAASRAHPEVFRAKPEDQVRHHIDAAITAISKAAGLYAKYEPAPAAMFMKDIALRRPS